MNFLYCLDENYNLQALNSINSLVTKTSERVNFYIIHKNPQSFEILFEKHINKKMINKLYTYKFTDQDIIFPKVKNSHVSEATYYRLFFDKFIKSKDIEYLIYLDSDILCLNNPIDVFKNEISKMKKDLIPLGAKTEGTRLNSKDLFEKLGLKNDNHFNAGVLIIDYQYWVEKKVSSKLINILEKRFDKIIYWDQDILNIYFDDNYSKLNPYLNFNHSVFSDQIIQKEELSKILFLHYSGKNKPWDVLNILNENTNFYQQNFKKLNIGEYHIEFNLTKKNLKEFFKIVFGFKFKNLDNPYKFLILSIKALLKSLSS